MHSTAKPLRRTVSPLAFVMLSLLTSTMAMGQPAIQGTWTEPFAWPDNATHATVLPTGKVMTWNEYEPEEFHLWDPVSGAVTTAPHPGYNIFCTGHGLLSDGRLLVSGGSIEANRGLPHASIYDPLANTWTRLPDMNAGRWYPTNTALPNGEMLVIAGTISQRRLDENRLPQVWQPSTGTWRDLSGALRTVNQYPWMFVAPDGRVFMAGPDPMSAYLDTSGTGTWTMVGERAGGEAIAGSAVMYDDGKVVASGGGEDFPIDTVEVIDLNSPAPAWRVVQPMAQARKQHTMTLLPDGTVLVTGGSSGPGKDDVKNPVLGTELWDPLSEQFTELAPSMRYRGYHSTAMLLPDGRVLSAGGQETGKDAQIFSPPYLFKGPRPTIAAAPQAVGYGESFLVSTPEAASIARVALMRPSSVTHAFDQNQRISRPAFTREAGGVRVIAPANSKLAPPGDYLLFILNDQGVPSIASWIKLAGADTAPPPTVAAVGLGDPWRYDERGIDPGEGWTSAAFDDSGWKGGSGSFSSRDQAATLLQLGDSPTAYFRKKLWLRGTAEGGQIMVHYEAGVEVWLNGTLLLSRNIESGADHLNYATAAAGSMQMEELSIPPGVLVEGENQLAVRVKRVQPSEADPAPALQFDLALTVATRGQVEPAPMLSITSPNGGETLHAGSTFDVAWQTLGALETVRLEYSTDQGRNWQPIEAALTNTGRHTWTVPALDSAQVLLRVAGASGPASPDASDAPFSITTEQNPQGVAPGEAHGEQQGCTAVAGPPVLGLLAVLAWTLRRRRSLRLLLIVAPPVLVGCGEKTQSITFAAQVRGEPLRCDTLYPDVGSPGTTLELLDFKVYVRDIWFVREGGAKYLLHLAQDGLWQRENVALLDFEDGTGTCNTGSPEMRTEVVGRVPDYDDYTGVEFTVGVPSELNHMNMEWEDPPLDVPSMWWSWKNGYKFLRLDVRTGGNASYVFHVGADGCEGTPDVGIHCSAGNQGQIHLDGFEPGQSRIVFDLAALFAHTDFAVAAEDPTDLVAGCLSSASDPECAGLFSKVGIGSDGAVSDGPSAFIRLE